MNNQPLTGFEQETVKNMRSQEAVLKDARMMAALIVEVTAGWSCDECDITDPEALHWLSHRLRDHLDLLAAHTGAKDVPGWMLPEEVA
ncbi:MULTISPECIES: hypothetical protein [Acetobacter]|nr:MULTISPECIES: hypothetical protein [Acetobacter]ATI11565.1 hypothetical protein CPF11_03210 [Acetobacter pomorum]AXC26099.1 hypothetical protein DS739_04460 [Acetobacter sp. JWB]KAA8427430.1 hypothetical protein FKW54_05795 [Acetobacter pomorum]KAA8432660.1 hypothetical protein FKW50_10840 [Acetobacter pomorum]KAA8454803.1 hypothetical protein FKW52_00090 [Acetobacter pomorum]